MMVNYVKGDEAEHLVVKVLGNLARCPMRSATAFRNAMFSTRTVCMINPILKMSDDDSAEKLLTTLFMDIAQAVHQGRMIDFGNVPNAVIKSESLRARAAFEVGDLVHPFDDVWLGTMAWEGGFNGYYVTLNPNDQSELSVIELYGVQLEAPVVLVYDAIGIKVRGPGDTLITPAPVDDNYRFSSFEHRKQFEESRGANSLDPLVTMLRFLADASIPVMHAGVDDKLAKARAKAGKPAIPPHTVVGTRDYVSHVTSHGGGRGHDHGGTHASPVAHWRRSHLRHVAADRVVKVRSSKVNWRTGDDFHRLFYQVKQETGHAEQR